MSPTGQYTQNQYPLLANERTTPNRNRSSMIPYRYKDEDFQIVLSPSPDGNQKYVRCRVSFNPINDKRFESDMLLSREFVNEDFYDHVCYETLKLYNKSLIKGIDLHSKFDENNSGQ